MGSYRPNQRVANWDPIQKNIRAAKWDPIEKNWRVTKWDPIQKKIQGSKMGSYTDKIIFTTEDREFQIT